MPNASTRFTRLRPQRRAQPSTALTDGLHAGDGQPAVLQEPGPVGLDRGQGVEVADRSSSCAATGSVQRSIAATKAASSSGATWASAAASRCGTRRVEGGERVAVALAGRRSRRARPSTRCRLAVLEGRALPAPVEQVGVLAAPRGGVDDALQQRASGRALDDRAHHLVGDEPHRAQRVQRPEVVAVARQQPLGHQLQQHRVVTLEGREDVGVGLELRQPRDTR